jgi:hypothetical protein
MPRFSPDRALEQPMHRISSITILAFLVLTAADQAVSQDDSEEITDEGLEALTVPSEPHELLAGTVGDWSLTIRVWSSPDAEPVESTGSASGRWILGDRFVETTFEGEVMGRPFEALKIEGYETANQEYVSTWRDNLGTYTMIFRGRCASTCATRTMTAEFRDPVTSKKLKIKGVTTLTDEEGGYTYESLVVTPDGQEFKNMELVAAHSAP